MADTIEVLDYEGLSHFKSQLNGVDIVTLAGDDGAAYTATIPNLTALKAGISFTAIPAITSTAALPTLNVNGLGAKYIRRRVSNSTVTTVASASANWLYANKPIRVTFDGTYWIADMDRPNAADLYGTLGIASGGTGASTADAALENLGGLKMVKIWENEYPTTNFAAQTLSFPYSDENEAKMYAIHYQYGTGSDVRGRLFQFAVPGVKAQLIGISYLAKTRFRAVNITVDDSNMINFAFADGYHEGSVQNGANVPIEIYAVKGVIE